MDNWDVPQIGNIYVHFHSGSIFQLCLFKWRCELLIISTDDRRYVSQHRDFPIVNKPTHPPQQPRYSWSNIQFRFRKVPPRGTSRSKTPRRYGAKGFDLNRVQVEGMWWPSDCRVWWKHTTSKLSRKFWRFVFLHRNDLCFWNFGGVFLLVAKIFQNTHNFPPPGRFTWKHPKRMQLWFRWLSFSIWDDFPASSRWFVFSDAPGIDAYGTKKMSLSSRSRSHQDVAFKGGRRGKTTKSNRK